MAAKTKLETMSAPALRKWIAKLEADAHKDRQKTIAAGFGEFTDTSRRHALASGRLSDSHWKLLKGVVDRDEALMLAYRELGSRRAYHGSERPIKNPPLAVHVARGECKPVEKVRKNPSNSPKSLGRRTGVDDGRPLWWAYSKVRNRFDLGNTWLLVGCETEAEARKIAPQLQAHIHAADRYGSTVGTTTKAVTLRELRATALKGVRPNERALHLFNAHLLSHYGANTRALLGL